jgi:hypothetical protein
MRPAARAAADDVDVVVAHVGSFVPACSATMYSESRALENRLRLTTNYRNTPEPSDFPGVRSILRLRHRSRSAAAGG